MFAALGIHSCFPHSHGSQGCCAYHRSALSRHYKEPIMAGTSSFTEGSSVFGGQSNLVAALDNIFTVYDPDIVAVHTTCLSETIGDDVGQIVKKATEDGKVPQGKHVVYASTPSYQGSHVTGYANMLAGIVRGFACTSEIPRTQLNIIAGWMEPSDMRQIKRLCADMGVSAVLLPDTSDVLDAPQTGKHVMFPKGGTSVAALVSTGDSRVSLGLGHLCTSTAAKVLDRRCKVPFEILDIPLGIRATDRFVMALSRYATVDVPAAITEERGRLVDVITDMQQYLYGKRVALWGDPDQLIPLTEFLLDLEMKPVYIVSGTPGRELPQRLTPLLRHHNVDAKIAHGPTADMFLLHQWIKNESVDLLIGNTYGKYIARDEGIPLLRMGFPIYDRIGHSYFPSVGYEGALRLLEKILDLFLNQQDALSPEESFELVM